MIFIEYNAITVNSNLKFKKKINIFIAPVVLLRVSLSF